ncbi:MAG: helix-turn-helix transcriptional regulator [Clostridia bacterium]|nr:helix-turn-helix transcriptional regulator [Clostridia bacterium]
MPYIRVPLNNILNVDRIITLYRLSFQPDYASKGEAHDFWEMVYVDEGEVGLLGGDIVHRAVAGELVLHKPNEFHRVVCDGEHAAKVFIVTFECHSNAMRFFHDKVLALPADLRGLMRLLMEECDESFHVSHYPLKPKEHRPIGGLQLIQNYLECIFIRLMRSGAQSEDASGHFYHSRETMEHRLTRDMTAYLEEHVCERLSLETLSEEFHFGVSTLCNIYKRVTGETIMHSFLLLKIEEAKRLLRENTESIADISAHLSFETPQYFSRIFRRYVGLPPKSFREESQRA